MLWVLLFIAGLMILLVGVMSLILKGPRLVNSLLASLGVVVLVSGAGGVIFKPRLPAFDVASLPLPAPAAPEPESQPDPEPLPAPAMITPSEPTPAQQPSVLPAPASAKDESQLAPIKLPAPLSVPTTTVVGTETDPLTDTSATPPQTPAPEPTPAPATPAQPPPPTEAEKLAALAPQQTREESAFTKAVSDARTEYDKAGDDDRASVQSSRAADICAAVKKPDIQGWVGTVKELDRDPGGRTILSIALPDGTLVKTWNNAMSDIDDKTLILAGTPLAAAVGKLAVGDAVRFSGSFFPDDPDCFRSSRLSLDQSMTEPSFLFRFASFDKL
ncbi:hypothetical protein SAMN02745157_4247 [Kaistia soli DSM 19436]|uniref:Uncharacterized protein n=1 Tax=Kaistia soli DSM 19436 TaxID=1122133 RepID=A0A1M5JZD3_9HYPH|nr:hypothetical protein [Kaistia soli]SHG45868.1 hypothetical protein SAMN02745157_4247 [Kaistia soli DSM 19436]